MLALLAGGGRGSRACCYLRALRSSLCRCVSMLCLDGSGYFSHYCGAEVLVFAQPRATVPNIRHRYGRVVASGAMCCTANEAHSGRARSQVWAPAVDAVTGALTLDRRLHICLHCLQDYRSCRELVACIDTSKAQKTQTSAGKTRLRRSPRAFRCLNRQEDPGTSRPQNHGLQLTKSCLKSKIALKYETLVT